jgi:hypothetical protein
MHTIDNQPTSDHSTVLSMNIYQTETYQFARRRFARLVMRWIYFCEVKPVGDFGIIIRWM